MRVRLTYVDGTVITLTTVADITMTGYWSYKIRCFGNEPVEHKNVLRIEIDHSELA